MGKVANLILNALLNEDYAVRFKLLLRGRGGIAGKRRVLGEPTFHLEIKIPNHQPGKIKKNPDPELGT